MQNTHEVAQQVASLGCWTRSPPAATSCCGTAPPPTTPTSHSARDTRRPGACPTSRAASSRSAGASRDWSWWTPVWCRSPVAAGQRQGRADGRRLRCRGAQAGT
jgi:hypothetical protein